MTEIPPARTTPIVSGTLSEATTSVPYWNASHGMTRLRLRTGFAMSGSLTPNTPLFVKTHDFLVWLLRHPTSALAAMTQLRAGDPPSNRERLFELRDDWVFVALIVQHLSDRFG